MPPLGGHRLVERNAQEFKRLHALLTQVLPSAEKAEKHTEWKSEGSKDYESRLTEARKLVSQLAEGCDKAALALVDYAIALGVAKAHYSNGKANEQALAELIHTKGTAITREAQEAEAMRQWEDMRATTGVMDFLAEMTMDVDDIRDDANRLHDAAGGDFHLAGTTEHEARELCLHRLKQAYDLLPDFRLGLVDRVNIVGAIPALRREAAEASANPLTRLAGSGPKQDYYPTAGHGPVSPTLQNIRLQIAGPIAPESLPWRLAGDPDNTSMGPIAIQVRRGAEVLGYDPDNLTDQQRNVVEDSLQDPAQNIFIASEYLAQLKAESEFADVPAEEMTPAQYQELAARYNGGPYWQDSQAQGYGRGFMNNLNDAKGALR
ncbi:hypothetical protein GT028_15575 [Streptomyces sp. SID2999]|uniref:hypothetical protein n=1 Tax=Streptomyces sp. SID2999 TaxID=2690258 RepID=UPI001368F81B|nr:hypothetical protein [Streptomyces sp. SID2999]